VNALAIADADRSQVEASVPGRVRRNQPVV